MPKAKVKEQVTAPCGPVVNVGLRRTKLKPGEKAGDLLAKLRKDAGDEPASDDAAPDAENVTEVETDGN